LKNYPEPTYISPDEEEFDPVIECEECEENTYEVDSFRDMGNMVRCQECALYHADEELEKRALDEQIYKVR
jgi:uncharacterized Zn finger protein